MKALVVDDSMTIRRIVIKSLELVGIREVVEASNGAEAVQAAAQQPFDVILMDWNMPQLTGVEALAQIRASGCRTPVIMVTTEAEKSRVIEAIRTGANDYLIKPFSPAQLAEKIRRILPIAAGA